MSDVMITAISPVDVGRAKDFPRRAGEVGWPALDTCAERAVELARQETTWARMQSPLEVEFLKCVYDECLAAKSAHPNEVIGHSRGHDGVDVIVPSSMLDENMKREVLVEGGGLLLSGADRFSTELNRMTGNLAVARRSCMGVLALFGSEPTRVLGPQSALTYVVPVNGDVIVHPDGAAPFDLAAGSSAMVEGCPRVFASSETLTVLFVEAAFTPWIRKRILRERARFHPLLRLDSPRDVGELLQVYGLDEPVLYVDLLRDEFDSLIENSPDELVRWWWLLGQSRPGFVAPREFEELVVRGRFAGGIGVHDDGEPLVVRGAGCDLAVPSSQIEFFEQLVAGGLVTCEAGSQEANSALNLLPTGVVEPIRW